MHACFHLFVMRNAMLIRITACHNGHMTRIRKRRVHRKHCTNQRAVFEHPTKVLERAHVSDVAFAKCIDHEYQKFGLAHLSTSFTFDNALKLRETIGYALFPLRGERT